MNGSPTIICRRRSRAETHPHDDASRDWRFAPATTSASKAFPMARSTRTWIMSRFTPRPTKTARTEQPCLSVRRPESNVADFDVVVNDDGKDHKDPHGEDAHSWD